MGVLSLKKWIFFVAAVSFISACGGGGDGDGGSDSGPVVLPESEDESTPPVDPDPVASGGLGSLIGSVTFRRNFSGDDTVYTSTALFTNDSYSTTTDGNEILLAANSTAEVGMGCQVIGSDEDVYLCNIVYISDGNLTATELFLFALSSSASGAGVFEYCTGDELPINICADEVANTPDGPLSVAISSGVAKRTGAHYVDNVEITPAEIDTFLNASELEFGGLTAAATLESPVDAQMAVLLREALLD